MRAHVSAPPPPPDGLRAAVDLLSSRWTALLVHDLSEGPRRFCEIQRACPGLGSRTLAVRLRSLVDHGLVERVAAGDGAGAYRLTGRGCDLLPVVDAMRAFGREWLERASPRCRSAGARGVSARARGARRRAPSPEA